MLLPELTTFFTAFLAASAAAIESVERCVRVADERGSTADGCSKRQTDGAKDFLLRIMPIGASITAGYSAGVLTNGYRKPLRDKLVVDGWKVDMVGTQSNGDMEDKQHEGYPGIRTEGLATQTASKGVVSTFHPNLLLLNVGTNDCSTRLDRTSARATYSNMIDIIFAPPYAANHTQFLIVSTLLPRRGTDAGQQNCTLYFNEEIRDLSRTHAQANRLGLADMNTGYITVDDLAPNDDLHPSAAGYVKMAEVWHAAINKAVTEGKIDGPIV